MEIYDILMLIVLVGAALFGAIKGFAWQLASIASIVVSYIVAYQFRGPFSESIQADPPWNRFLAMLILYVGTSLVIWVAFRMISGTIDRLKLREFDRHIGAVFGLAKGALFCTLITLFAVTLLGDNLRGKIVASKSGRYIAKVLDQSESVIPPEIHEVVRPYLDRFDERFDGARQTPESDGVLPWIADRISEVPGSGNVEGRLPESFWDTAAESSTGGAPPYPQQPVSPPQSPYAQQPVHPQQPVYPPPPGGSRSVYADRNVDNSTFPPPANGPPTYGPRGYGSQPSYGQPSSYRRP